MYFRTGHKILCKPFLRQITFFIYVGLFVILTFSCAVTINSFNRTVLKDESSPRDSLPSSGDLPHSKFESDERNKKKNEYEFASEPDTILEDADQANKTHSIRYPVDMLETNMFIDNNVAACKISSVNHVVVIIPSSGDHYYRRQVVRSTWANQKYLTDNTAFTFSFVFAIGQPSSAEIEQLVQLEQSWYHDLIVGNFVDSYYNLTLKMLTAFAWVDLYCPDVMFVVKGDDDSYINMDIVVAILSQVDQKQSYGGRCQKDAPPIRDRNNKFYVSEQEYPGTLFPYYCEGPFYFMSTDVVRKIARLCPKFPFLKLEDVFMGACIEKYINVSLFDLPHEVMPYSANNPKRVPRKAISVHKVSPGVLMQIYRKIHVELQPHKLMANSEIPRFLQNTDQPQEVANGARVAGAGAADSKNSLMAKTKVQQTIEGT